METILTLHPSNKKGIYMEAERYHTVRTFVLEMLRQRGELRFTELYVEAQTVLEGQFAGKVKSYLVTLRLDLEARGIIRCTRMGDDYYLRLTGL
jgi:hypothetical protein